MLEEKHFVLIGAGNIGCILLERLLVVGVPPKQLAVCDIDPERTSLVIERFGARPIELNEDDIYEADVLLIVTPPKTVAGIVDEISNWLRAGQLVISFVAAVPMKKLETALPKDVCVARVMPNAPSLIGEGMNPVVFGSSMMPDSREMVMEYLAILGESVEVHDEQMNWCVGLTGAAMASLVPGLEGMTRAGMEAGLPEEDSRRTAAQVMLGTASLALRTNLSFAEIKALTPMQTVDEEMVRLIFLDAALGVKEKMERLEKKIST
jgi:pyrroline-5-carboxylate reductase